MIGSAEVTIESIAAGGDGVGRVNGRVVFVPRSAPGDVGIVEVPDTGRFARAEFRELRVASPDRVATPVRALRRRSLWRVSAPAPRVRGSAAREIADRAGCAPAHWSPRGRTAARAPERGPVALSAKADPRAATARVGLGSGAPPLRRSAPRLRARGLSDHGRGRVRRVARRIGGGRPPSTRRRAPRCAPSRRGQCRVTHDRRGARVGIQRDVLLGRSTAVGALVDPGGRGPAGSCILVRRTLPRVRRSRR